MRNLRRINESWYDSGSDIILPSVERWIDDQFDMGYPETVGRVSDYLKAKDPGYRLLTVKGQSIVRDYANSYLNDQVDWLNQNFDFRITTQSKLCVVNSAFDGYHLIVQDFDYDMNDSFMNNLNNLLDNTVRFLRKFSDEKNFTDICRDKVRYLHSKNEIIGYVEDSVLETLRVFVKIRRLNESLEHEEMYREIADESLRVIQKKSLKVAKELGAAIRHADKCSDEDMKVTVIGIGMYAGVVTEKEARQYFSNYRELKRSLDFRDRVAQNTPDI